MQHHPSIVRNLADKVDQYGECADIAELRDALSAIQEERRLLKTEIAFEQHKNALMREALRKSRRAIEAIQAATPAVASPAIGRGRREAFRFPFFSILPRGQKDPLGAKGFARKRSDMSRYIARSALETIILRSAQDKVYGIRGVIIEFGWGTHGACESNWRIAGIIGGKSDRNAALAAVDAAAHENAAWVMVEDGSHLDGQPIESD